MLAYVSIHVFLTVKHAHSLIPDHLPGLFRFVNLVPFFELYQKKYRA